VTLRPPDPAGVLVIGYGNALRTDDGVGWHAARLLAGDPRFADVGVVALHQLTPELAFDLSLVSLVVLLDATTETPAGTVTVRSIAEAEATAGGDAGTGAWPRDRGEAAGLPPGASSHHVDPEILVVLARQLYGRAPQVVVVSVGVSEMGLGEGLTPAVKAALPAVADTVARLVAEHDEPAGEETRRPA
jgi:Ni,Fe-hydrogenase maturation factor